MKMYFSAAKKQFSTLALGCALVALAALALINCTDPAAPTKYTVTFDTNGGTPALKDKTVETGKTLAKPTPNPTKTGFIFAGWYKDQALTQAFDFNTEKITQNITLYARWVPEGTPVTYTVTFNLNGGLSAITKKTVETGTLLAKPTPNPTKTGFVFAGWYKDEGLTQMFNFSTEKITQNITLYAKWTSSSSSIAIKGITLPSPTTISKYKYGSKKYVLQAELTVEGNLNGLNSQERATIHEVSWEIAALNGITGVSMNNDTLIVNSNATTGDISIRATSVYDNTKSATATFRIVESTGKPTVLQAQTANQVGVIMDENEQFINLQLSRTDYNLFLSQDGFTDKFIESTSKTLYKYFNDDFDFIFLLLDEENIPERIYNYYGRYVGVKNEVKGIFPFANLQNQYDYSDKYGSSGNLEGLIKMPYVRAIKNGPFLHELAHRWANFSIETAMLINSVSRNFIPHWGFTGGSTKGQLGGFEQSTLRANVDGNPNKYTVDPFGSFANGGNSVPYTDFELYLMGMLPLSGVATFDVFTNLRFVDYSSISDSITFVANTRTTYDQAKLQATFNRSPNHANSQKSFRALVVVVSQNEMTSRKPVIQSHISWAVMDDDNRADLYTFQEATRGVGRLFIGKLSAHLK